MTSLYLRAAGVQQSWSGPRLTAHTVETLPTPTRSAMTGIIAAALGFGRGQWEPWLAELQFEVRVDNPGHRLDDFQTITPAPQLETQRITLWKTLTAGTKAQHKGRVFDIGSESNSVITSKHSLTGATMTIRVFVPSAGHDNDTRIHDVAQAIASPVFSPFLGRKAFAPTFPFLLGIGGDDLLDAAPALRTDFNLETRLPVYPAGEHSEANPIRTVMVQTMPMAGILSWWLANAVLPTNETAA
jgi:CRISPR system Cascade subunit CasD